MYWKELMRQMVDIGVSSIIIVAIISVFIGAVTTVQTAFQLVSPLIPDTVIGQIVRDSTIFELAPTITCLVLAGKVGSRIASEIATMRVSEQIDALEVMGVNTEGYLIGPKIIAALIVIPILTIISATLSIGGGLLVAKFSGVLSEPDFILGVQSNFLPFSIVLCLIKAATFAFIITSVSAFQGFNTKGGALEVGEASTKAVVYSCILILLFDYLIAELLLR